jgi:pyruvate/2-oxoglutarate/acetoin dehydrogenase E1 component
MSNIQEAMKWLSEQPNTIFIGQNICFPRNQMYDSLLDIPASQKIEMPVAEDFQMGISIGMAIDGNTIISLYPRFDFLLLATNQIVNHLNNFQHLFQSNFYPRILIRTMVGGTQPLNPGAQHTKDGTDAFKLLCDNMMIIELNKDDDPLEVYQQAYKWTKIKPVIVVEK